MSTSLKPALLVALVAGVILFVFIVLPMKNTEAPMPKVVVIQDKPQEWADALKLGLEDGLRELKFEDGNNVAIVHRSAAGDPQGLTSLAEAITRQGAAVLYTLGTQTTQTVVRSAGDTPVVFGAVTDPVKAGFYDKTLDNPKGNITGTQDLWPYPSQFDLIMKLLPRVKKIGTVYNSGEVNSQVSLQFIRRECEKRSIELAERNVIEESQVDSAVAGLVDSGIDAFFIPADNTAQTAAKTIIAVCMRKKIPVFTGIPGIVENGALGTVGTNYYELGRVNATQVAAILRGKRASEIPVSIADKGDLYLNAKIANELGISLPEDLKRSAFKIVE